ncbi:hypothetical protein F4779DRAFT_619256 [Xylariaceae sp. FL0662B]|nr:hypothetical protein F4779DRAFT_619256 [Xylariaceae sp. FL0662B]
MLQDLAALHEAVRRTADTIGKMSHMCLCMRLWDQIWLTLHMAGVTTECVWDSAADTVSGCNHILAAWESRREQESCLELYGVLREFPIAKRKKTRDAAWQAQDRLTRALMPGSLNRSVGWMYRIFVTSV